MPGISVVVITKNEESRIARALQSVRLLADEIIVVDDNSSDRTCAIARDEFGAKVFVRPLNRDFAAQRNFGADQASNEWILAMDADEVVPFETVQAVRACLEGNVSASALLLSRLNHLCGVPLPHVGRDMDHLRLYRKGRARFSGVLHERLDCDGPPVRVRADVWHFPADSVDMLIRKGLDYNDIDACRFVTETVSVSAADIRYHLTWRPFKLLWKLYIKKNGCRDGLAGLAWCMIHTIGPTIFWLKVWQFAQQAGKLKER